MLVSRVLLSSLMLPQSPRLAAPVASATFAVDKARGGDKGKGARANEERASEKAEPGKGELRAHQRQEWHREPARREDTDRNIQVKEQRVQLARRD